MSAVTPSCVVTIDTIDKQITNNTCQYIFGIQNIILFFRYRYLKGSLHEGMARETVLPFLHREVHRFSEMCILPLFTWKHHIHSDHLVLMVDIGSCLQQSLDCLGVSILSSYH